MSFEYRFEGTKKKNEKEKEKVRASVKNKKYAPFKKTKNKTWRKKNGKIIDNFSSSFIRRTENAHSQPNSYATVKSNDSNQPSSSFNPKKNNSC